jgi:hypothetical protein
MVREFFETTRITITLHSQDYLAAASQLKYESMVEQQRMRLATMTSTEVEQGDSGEQSVIKAVFLFLPPSRFTFSHIHRRSMKSMLCSLRWACAPSTFGIISHIHPATRFSFF